MGSINLTLSDQHGVVDAYWQEKLKGIPDDLYGLSLQLALMGLWRYDKMALEAGCLDSSGVRDLMMR